VPQLKQVADVTRALQLGRGPRPTLGWGGVVFLIGAGCSRSAGIPLAAEIAEDMCVDLAARYSNGMFQGQEPTEALAWLVKHGDLPHGLTWGDLYTPLFDNHFRDATHQRGVIGRATARATGINWTHVCIAELVARHYVHTVLTTNFDQLMLEGLMRAGVIPVVADGVESLTRIDGRPDVPQLVHLHGSRHTYNPRNTSRDVLETRRFGEVVRSLRELIRDSSALIVVGYAGREEGVMDVLIDAVRELGGKTIYWIQYDPNPQQLSSKASALLDSCSNGGLLVGFDADIVLTEIMSGVGAGVPSFMTDPLDSLRRTASQIVRPAARTAYAEITTYMERLEALRESDTAWKARRSERDVKLSAFRQLALAGRLSEAVSTLLHEQHLLTNEDLEPYGDVVLEAGKRVVDRELLDLAASVFHSAIEVSRESRDKARLYRKRGEALLSLAERQPDARFLEEAIESFRTSLSQLSQQESALDWAATQQELASALSLLGDRTGRNEALQQAIDALDAALKVRTRERLPIDWAETQRKRGAALRRLGQRLSDPDTLEKSIAAYRASLQVWTREQAPEEWAKVQTGLGGALCTLGDREQGIARLEEGVKAFTAALEVRTRERFPREWAATQNNLAAALVWLGERQRGDESLQAAVDASRLAMEVWSREQSPYDWARAQGNLGNALLGLGKRLGDGRSLRDAVEAYSAALAVWDEKQAATDWAMAQNNLGRALCALGQVENNTTILEEGIAKYQAALKGCADAPAIADRINDNLRVAIQFRESRKPSSA
jgi:tetratricopeptide (TPR) repeat protein